MRTGSNGSGRGQKNAARLGASLVIIDESGFLLIPTVRRTWAPRGHTPIHRHRTRREKVSVISGISISPRRRRLGLYYRLYRHNIGRAEVCEFLHPLLRHRRGHVIALLDNSPTHKGEPLRTLGRNQPRLHIEYFPPYAPTLNPDEGVWLFARRRLANGRPRNIAELRGSIARTLGRLAKSSPRLRGCVEHSELPPFLT